ncbi:MAG: hypothetical protein WC543_05140 [Candidatus Omnitrophota bacterium]
MLDQDKPKWYFKSWSLVVSFLCVGPFMLPLVWANPHLTKKSKIIISLIIIALTYLLVIFSVKSLKTIGDYYQMFSI